MTVSEESDICKTVVDYRRIKLFLTFQMLEHALQELDLPKPSHRIYEALLEGGRSSAKQLAMALGMARPSVYDNLKLLIDLGLVVERQEESKKSFQAENPEHISRLLGERIETLQKEKKRIEDVLPLLSFSQEMADPKVTFFAGAVAVRQMLNHMLLYRDVETVSLWPISQIVDALGEEYFLELDRKRVRQRISVRGLWPYDDSINGETTPYLGKGRSLLREVRMAPEGMCWDMGYWLCEDRTMLVSSRREAFGLMVHSRDFANMMRIQFEAVWQTSQTIAYD